jgi:Ring finger domain
MAVVFIQTPEHLVCFRFRSSASYIFVIFDAHSRSEHPSGPAFILASDIDTIATHFNQLLTQPTISKSASKQDVAANPYSFTALVIKSREIPLTIDVQDLFTKSVAFLSEKLTTVDHISSSLDLGAPISGHLEQLRVRAETLRTQKLGHKQDNNRQTNHSRSSTRSTRRSEFGWQLNLQVSGPPSTVDPKNNNLAESSRPLEVKKLRSTTHDHKSEFDWLRTLMPGSRLDGEDVDIAMSGTASRVDMKNIPDNTLLHMHSRTEFGWQLALQQTSKTDRRKLEDLEVMASAVASQADIQMHKVLLGKGKEASGEVFAKQTVPEGSASIWEDIPMKEEEAWEDVLMKQLQEEEELVASSAGFLLQEKAWLLSLQKRLGTEEDKDNDAVASSSLPHAQLGQKGITSTYLHEFDYKPLPLTEGESSTMPHRSCHSPIFPTYFDTLLSSNRGFTTLELPTSGFPAESHECGVCNELYGIDQIIQLPTCTHTFCKDCLRTFTKTKIREGRYPIFCPVCAIERTRVNQSREFS